MGLDYVCAVDWIEAVDLVHPWLPLDQLLLSNRRSASRTQKSLAATKPLAFSRERSRRPCTAGGSQNEGNIAGLCLWIHCRSTVCSTPWSGETCSLFRLAAGPQHATNLNVNFSQSIERNRIIEFPLLGVVQDHTLNVFGERRLCHLRLSSYIRVFVQFSAAFACLRLENRHTAPHDHEDVLLATEQHDLLGFNKVSLVFVVVYATDIESGSCSEILPPGDNGDVDWRLLYLVICVADISADNGSAPFYADVIFCK